VVGPARGVKRQREDESVQLQQQTPQQQAMERQLSNRQQAAPPAVMAADASGQVRQQSSSQLAQNTQYLRHRINEMSQDVIKQIRQQPFIEMSPQDRSGMTNLLEKMVPPMNLDRVPILYGQLMGEDATRDLLKAVFMLKFQIGPDQKAKERFNITFQQAQKALQLINNCRRAISEKLQRPNADGALGATPMVQQPSQNGQTQSPQRIPPTQQQNLNRPTPQLSGQQPQQAQGVPIQRQPSKQPAPQQGTSQNQPQQNQPQQQGKTTPSTPIFHQAPDGVPVYDNSAEKPINLQWPPLKKARGNNGQTNSNVPPPAPTSTKLPPFPEIKPQQKTPVPQHQKLPVTKVIPEPASTFRCTHRTCSMILKNKEELDKHMETHKSHLLQVWEKPPVNGDHGGHCLEVVGTSLGVLNNGDNTGSPSIKMEPKMKLEDEDDMPMMDRKKDQLLQNVKEQDTEMPTPPTIVPTWENSQLDQQSVLECFEGLVGIEGVINNGFTMLTPAYTPPLNEQTLPESDSKAVSTSVKDDKDEYEEGLTDFKPFGTTYDPVDWESELGFSVDETNDWTNFFEVSD
jgi:hypothetical protein